MGFVFTLLYIVTAYLSPAFLFGELRQYHVGIVLAVLAFLASVPSLVGSRLLRTPQTYLIIGLSGAVILSLIANRWFGGAVQAIQDFLPQGFAFFLVAVNFRSIKKLKILVLALYAVAAVTIIMAMQALAAGDWNSPFLLSQAADNGEHFYRIRGLASISDPNDLSQLLVSLLPLLWINWVPKRQIRNFLLVLVPAAFLIFGMFQTHSRGAAIALVAIMLVGLRPRLGTLRTFVLAGIAVTGVLALNWSGGREISVEAGSGRMEAWGVGLQLLKANPIFGVGFNRFTEFNWITAHNTLVVCAAELGLFGLYFWINAVAFTTIDLVRIKSSPEPACAGAGEERVEEFTGGADEQVRKTRILQYWARLLLISLVGFLTAGWFLSRAYVLTLFLYMGIAQVLHELAVRQEIVPQTRPVSRMFRIGTVAVGISLCVVYAMIRIRNFV